MDYLITKITLYNSPILKQIKHQHLTKRPGLIFQQMHPGVLVMWICKLVCSYNLKHGRFSISQKRSALVKPKWEILQVIRPLCGQHNIFLTVEKPTKLM